MGRKIGFTYRCRNRTARATFKRKVETYYIEKKCKRCGSKNFRHDKYRQHKERRKNVCRCDAYHFPHRVKSGECYENCIV